MTKTNERAISKNMESTSTKRAKSGKVKSLKSDGPSVKTRNGSALSATAKDALSPSSTPNEAKGSGSSPRGPRTEPKERIVTKLLGEDSGLDRTDWARIRAMTDEEIERNAMDDPDNPLITDCDFENAVIIRPPRKESIHLRVDADVLAWFRANGPGHLTYMNSVLRKWYETKSRQQRTA